MFFDSILAKRSSDLGTKGIRSIRIMKTSRKARTGLPKVHLDVKSTRKACLLVTLVLHDAIVLLLQMRPVIVGPMTS